MRRGAAAAGTSAFLAAVPGTVAGLVPWLLTRWESGEPPPPLAVRLVGGVLVLLGGSALLVAFVRFVGEGRGTPAPVAPTEELVVGGPYRYVRNPMYVAVVALVLGQALLLGRLVLLAYALVTWATTAAFVRGYEEPTLLARYGEQYEAYRAAVPAWLPRLTPWRGGASAPRPSRPPAGTPT
ncbi:isoprenylcysteine carboxylmethyltransferase family protein [Actinotalea ferrariae]|uniref:methyltransferase family protein n=1 Tax=Actinotalea ferrariae TaxID=1386098 RepID=UPI001C8B9548|nr:isoprenylcysteine carboxylmethyltransferase family protein [Actinotalea ferrariae]MBX9243772.1 isoprenylcysteine carboxylmethyltransferase family protein [Actinotalea ferrariae]